MSKPPLPAPGYFFLGLLCGVALGFSIGAKAEDVPVTVAIDFSHEFAIVGQKVWLTWRPTSGSTQIQSCRLRLLADDQEILAEDVNKSRWNRDVIMPDASYLMASLECVYSADVPGGTVSLVVSDGVQRTTRAEITAGTENGPDCYPAPVGSGSKVYGASYRDPDGKDSSCVLWFCEDTPRSFCFRWDLADWSIAALAAAKDAAGLDAKWTAAPWEATSINERAIVAALFNEHRPRYYAARNSTYTTRPVYERTAEGLRGPLVKTSRVAVGAECNCLDRLATSSRYCSVAGQVNALRPAEILPDAEGPADSRTGGSYSLCASQ